MLRMTRSTRLIPTPPWREIRLDIDPVVAPDIVAAITNMEDVATESVDAVWSSHSLEHLFPHEVPLALQEFARILKPGGFVLITLPDIEEVAKHIAGGNLEDPLYVSPAGPISPIDRQ
jgi:predicted SAM-dependent methyltransferase